MNQHDGVYLYTMRMAPLFLCAATAMALVSMPALADEGGVAFWMSGSNSALSAVPATPGWSMPTVVYYYSADAEKTKEFIRGGSVSAGLDSRVPLLLVQPSYAPTTKVMGGQASIGVGVGFARNTTSAEIRLSQLNTQFDVSDSVSGVTDLYPIASVAWNKGVHNWMTYVTGDIPIGSYDSTRLANVGIGHAAMDAGGAYTYFNPTTGVEFWAEHRIEGYALFTTVVIPLGG